MDALMALAAGITAKVYDDTKDMGLLKNEYFKKGLETLACFLLGGLAINNFTFSVAIFLASLVNNLGDSEAFKEPYEFSLLLVAPLFIFFSFPQRQPLSVIDVCAFFLTALFCYFEPKFVKEDASARKFVYRTVGAIVLSFFLFFDLGLSRGFHLLLVGVVGYVITSSFFQAYHVSKMTTDEFMNEFINGIEDDLNILYDLVLSRFTVQVSAENT
jgi:hypothetical protein